MKTNLKISLNFLLHNKNQTFFIVLGISVSIAIQFFLMNMASGLQKFMITQLIGSNYHIRFERGEARQNLLKNLDGMTLIGNSERTINRISEYESIIKSVSEVEGVTAVAGYITDGALYFQNGKTRSMVVIGADLKAVNKIYKISDKLVEGTLNLETNSVMVGVNFAKDFNLKLNDQISLTMPNGTRQPFRITGIFDVGAAGSNKNLIYMDLSYAQSLYDQNGFVSTIDLQLADPFQADNYAEYFSNRFRDLKVSSWTKDMKELLVGLTSQTFSILLIQFFITLASILSVSTILGVIVMQKSKQLGILKTMGLTNASSRNIFLFQGAILGFVTCFVGAIFGTIVIKLFVNYSPIGFDIPLSPKFSTIILAVSFFSCLLASIYPALKSKKLNPIDIIRGN
ncbi:MAG: ABC transporter permease [Fusobacteriaceae bacterium]